MKLIILFFFFSCSKQFSAYQNWTNGEVKKISITEDSSHLFDHESNCDFEAKVVGIESHGELHYKENPNCQNPKTPLKSTYQAVEGSLRVCTDYKNGDHACEKFKPAI